MLLRRLRFRTFSLLLVPAILGCSGSKPDASVVEGEKPAAAAGLQPFDAPPLAEIDARAEWIDMPVEDGLQLLNAELAKTKPPLSVAEALKLKNDSDDANEKILQTLGRQPTPSEPANYDATLVRYLKADIKNTNPVVMQYSVDEGEVQSFIAYGLFSFDWNLRPFAVKEFVKSWQVSKDRMFDKVVLRDDAVWSDGKPITAHDVVFSFQTILDPRVPSPAVRSQTDELRWVEAYDDYTLVFFHKKSAPTNVWKVNFPVIPRHVYERSLQEGSDRFDPTLQDTDYHVKLENDPVVGGAYRIVKRVRNQEIVLERRDDYYLVGGKQVRDKPYFKTIRFRITQDPNVALLAMKNGELDEMLLQPEQWVEQTTGDDFYAKNTKAKGVEWVYFYFGWNMKEPSAPFFADVRVRRAMAYAFDHDELLKTLCYDLYQPATGIFHPSAPMFPKTPTVPYKRDIAKAEALLDEAGWKDSDGDGVRDKEIDGRLVPFDFTILCANAPLRVSICNLLKQNLEEIGVRCTVRPLEPATLFTTMEKHQYQANFGGWGTGADPSTLKNIWQTGEGRNYGGYSNPEVDRLIKEAEQEFDRDKQLALYAQIHELIYEDQPCTFLYYQNSFYAFSKKLRGYRFSPRGPYHYNPGVGAIWSPVGY